MRDVVVIGGGLTGLAAACELERLGVAYTMIEVKRRLGGSIASTRQGDFVFDSGPMYHPVTDLDAFRTTLDGIGLNDVEMVANPNGLVFPGGTGALVDALAQQITAPVMARMAVSTLGEIDPGKRFSICLENGMVLDARALIIASPARFAERMLHTLVPEAGHKLLDYRYAPVVRVSVGYSNMDPSSLATLPAPDTSVIEIQVLTGTDRVPRDGLILQATVRFDPDAGLPEEQTLLDDTLTTMGWLKQPAAHYLGAWSESDPEMFREAGFVDMIAEVNQLLPDRVALIGSDYIPTNSPPHLDLRIKQGIAAAQRIASHF